MLGLIGEGTGIAAKVLKSMGKGHALWRLSYCKHRECCV
jgi:hypothetical protein